MVIKGHRWSSTGINRHQRSSTVIKYYHLSSQRSLQQQLGLALRDRRSLTLESERRLERLKARAQIGLLRLRLGARGARRGAFFELHLLQPTGKLLVERFLREGDRELLGDLMREAIIALISAIRWEFELAIRGDLMRDAITWNPNWPSVAHLLQTRFDRNQGQSEGVIRSPPPPNEIRPQSRAIRGRHQEPTSSKRDSTAACALRASATDAKQRASKAASCSLSAA